MIVHITWSICDGPNKMVHRKVEKVVKELRKVGKSGQKLSLFQQCHDFENACFCKDDMS